jgi:hypothetical protein
MPHSIDLVVRIAEKGGEYGRNLQLQKMNLREDLKSLDIITMIVQ